MELKLKNIMNNERREKILMEDLDLSANIYEIFPDKRIHRQQFVG